MRTASLLALACVVACSSSFSPGHNALAGNWKATGAIGTGVDQFTLSLVQNGDTITGSAALLYTDHNRQDVFLQVTGRAGLDTLPCLANLPSTCNKQFAFTASDTLGDTIFYAGQLKDQNEMFGAVRATAGLPYQNVDGYGLEFTRYSPATVNR